MNYIIYGAGYRGKKLLDYIGTRNVLAFIDSDETKQGKEYYKKPIITIDEYIKKYTSCFIIITPAYNKNIESMLEEYNIYQYSNLEDMPSEFSGYGYVQFEDCYSKLKNDFEGIVCYGLNALSLLIYDFIIGDKEITICPEEECKPEKLEWIKKFHPQIKLKTYADICENEIILLSTGRKNKKMLSNMAIDLFEYANDNRQYRNNKLLKFKDIYKKKKKCFIVATGPSLCINDLHTLKANNIFCFGVNNILKIEEEWIPDCYVATDSYFISNNMQDIENYDCNIKFIGDACHEYWEKKYETSYKIHVVKSSSETNFSEEIAQKLYGGYNGGGTVTYICLQLAVYMGFTEIYLLGVDCNYVMGSRNNHFIEEKAMDNKNHGVDLMIKGYMFAKKYADEHSIKIYNATRGGMLEVFERVDFDSIFKRNDN